MPLINFPSDAPNVQRIALSDERAAEELSINGAPEGDQFLANVVERSALPKPKIPVSEFLSTLVEQTAFLNVWYEKFAFVEKVRSVVVHNATDVAPVHTAHLAKLLLEMSESSTSVLAHQALACVGDLLNFCPTVIEPATFATLSETLMSNSQHGKPKVQKARVENILGEVTCAEDAVAMSGLVLPLLDKKYTTHSDSSIVEKTFTFAENAAVILSARASLGVVRGMSTAIETWSRVEPILRSAFLLGHESKSAKAKASAKRGLGVLEAALKSLEPRSVHSELAPVVLSVSYDLGTAVQASSIPSPPTETSGLLPASMLQLHDALSAAHARIADLEAAAAAAAREHGKALDHAWAQAAAAAKKKSVLVAKELDRAKHVEAEFSAECERLRERLGAEQTATKAAQVALSDAHQQLIGIAADMKAVLASLETTESECERLRASLALALAEAKQAKTTSLNAELSRGEVASSKVMQNAAASLAAASALRTKKVGRL